MGTILRLLSFIALTFLGWVFDQTTSYQVALLPIVVFYGLACVVYLALRPPLRFSPTEPRP